MFYFEFDDSSQMKFLFILNKAEESQILAKRISLLSIWWNTMWNMWLFNIHSTYAIEDRHYSAFALPSIMYFTIWLVFEITLIHHWWRARNGELFQQNRDVVRRQIILFYLKFYIVYIVAVSLSDYIFSYSFLLVIMNGLIWIPQIIENVINRSRNVPMPSFLISLSLSQGFMPVYYLLFGSNIFEFKSSPKWGLTLLFIHWLSIVILLLQRKYGSRFFIPKYFKNKSDYQYQSLSNDVEQDADKDWAIWLNHLSENQGTDEEHRDNYSKIYMRTPWGHNFHPSWLKTWMNQKLECPFCRTQIPAIDSDDEEIEIT